MEKPDQGHNFEAGDTAMTVEFLRARLLSERSVSKSAKQRADELADRVAELEEQLKVVSLQRKKAEKATSDVLAILENLGISDYSEGYESSSDQDVSHSESVDGNCAMKNTDLSTINNQQGHDSPSFFHRSLSWKSNRCSLPASERKFMSASSRRRNSFMPTDSSSPKHRVGKSCRQVKRREMRSAVDELRNNHSLLVPRNDCQLSRNTSINQDKDVSHGDPEQTALRSTKKLVNSEKNFHTHDRDSEMEIALEYQAELIGRYEAEENAQIEWEEKYKEINCSTPESFEPGNQSDVTEERYEWKGERTTGIPVNEKVCPKVQGTTLIDAICGSVKNDVQPASSQVEEGPEKYQSEQFVNQGPDPDLTSPSKKSFQIHQKPESYSCHPPSPAISHSASPVDISSSLATDTEVTYREGENSKARSEKSLSSSNGPSEDLGSVLEALQLAKRSLQHTLRKFSHSEDRFVGKSIEPYYAPALMSVTRAEMPVSCAALFRVPSDFQDESNAYNNLMDSSSQPRFMNNFQEAVSSTAANNQFSVSQNGGVTRFNVPEGKAFDFTPNKEITLSNLVNRDQYAWSPSVHSNRSFSSNGQLKLDLQLGAQSTFAVNDQVGQSPHLDSQFSFPTYDHYKFSSLPESSRPALLLGDQHGQGLFRNKQNTPSSNLRELNSRGETTRSSLIDRNLNVQNPYTESGYGITNHSLYDGYKPSIASHRQVPENTTRPGPESSTRGPHYSPDLHIGLPSNARHSYPTPPSIPDMTPQIPTFSFPSFPRSQT